MEELHAAIAAYLRAQRGLLGATSQRETAILNIWHDRYMPPRCRVCGVTIDSDEDGLYNLADMLTVRECRNHYTPF
jgi:hypothetical protein